MTIKCCKNFKDRLIGFMFKRKKIDFGLCFPKCNSIHTFFMFQAIDVVMTDINHQIKYIYPKLKPWKIISPKRNVYYTYELPLGSANNLKINDLFKEKTKN